MTDNGGGEPGNRSPGGDADSWFKPSENRFRKQSEYQDPMDEQGVPEGDAPADGAAVFPDSGGYAGLSASRPALADPYPDALGVPPSAHRVDPSPASSEPTAAPGALSYPGAGTSAYQPLTRVPGEPRPAWEGPGAPERPSEPRTPSFGAEGGEEPWGSTEPAWSNDPGTGGGALSGPETAPIPTEAPAWGTPESSHDLPGSETHEPSAWGSVPSSFGSVEPGTERPFEPEPSDAPAAWEPRTEESPEAPSWGSSDTSHGPLAADPVETSAWDQPSGGAAEPSAWDVPETSRNHAEPSAWGPSEPEELTERAPSEAPFETFGGQTPDRPGPPEASWTPDTGSEAAAWGSPEPSRDLPGSEPEEPSAWGATAPSFGSVEPSYENALEAETSENPFRDPLEATRDPLAADPVETSAWDPSSGGAAEPSAWDTPEASGGLGEDSWDRRPETGTFDEPASGWDTDAAEPSWESRSPSLEETPEPFPTGGYPGIAASAEVPLPPEGAEDVERVPAPDTWASTSTDAWSDSPSGNAGPLGDVQEDRAWAAEPSSPTNTDAWNDPRAWGDDADPLSDAPREWRDTEERSPFTSGDEGRPAWGEGDPLSDPGTFRRDDPTPSYDGDGYDDELSPRSSRTSHDRYEERADDPLAGGSSYDDRYEDDRYEDELSAKPAAPGTFPDDGGLGAGSGNTWAFDRDDLRLPDVVRDAERRRREAAPEGPTYREWGEDPLSDERSAAPDTGELSAAVPASDDPLAAIADMQSRAREKEPWGEDEDGYADEYRGPAEPEASWNRGAAGATQMFTAPSFDEGPSDRASYGPGDDSPFADDRGYPDRPHDDRGYGDLDDFGPDEDDRFYDERGGFDARGGPAPASAGIPSDLGGGPLYDQGGSAEAWNGPTDRPASIEDDQNVPVEDEGRDDPEYDDGFTPADYGMSERPRPAKRRRDRIAEDFPGFEDRPLGGEPGDAYPGYDSVDFLADTEPGANLTLWLGVASLIPGLGVITAIIALFVTGPKAKRAIRESRGELDGLGLITTGTVFAVIGILVTVISVAIWLIL
ncbi:hypothetical protein ACFW3Z_11930 [Nocardiopsis alba]|uniref:hypothetical protein n=1 Tax=Nocardiopsis alba TaxID=53437 RepID=UPI00366E88F2